MRIPVSEGRSFIPIGRTQRYVLFKYLRRKRLCDPLILAAHHACFCVSSMVEEQEIFLKMSMYRSKLPIIDFTMANSSNS